MFCRLCGEKSDTKIHKDCWDSLYIMHNFFNQRYCICCGTSLQKRRDGKNTSRLKCVKCHTESLVVGSDKHNSFYHSAAIRDKRKILYECKCISKKTKHFHIIDYYKPLEGIMLCGDCHRKEHARLNAPLGLDPKDLIVNE